MAVGEIAPDFSLPDTVSKKTMSLADVAKGKNVVVLAIASPHCPFVVHVAPAFGALSKEFPSAAFVAISSNSVVTHPQDGPDNMAAFSRTHGWDFPFLFDEQQVVAKAYKAMCTPEFFVFRKDANGALRLSYHVR